MTLNSNRKTIWLLCFGLMLAACSTHAAKGVAPASVDEEVSSVAADTPMVVSSGCDADSKMARTQRLAVIESVAIETENEIDKNPTSIADEKVRARVGTFAAGTIDDDTPFVSVDRTCWADFYEARKALNEKKDEAAKKAGRHWQTCPEATFPDRVALAKPYFSCFGR